jgi:hypothetical protein
MKRIQTRSDLQRQINRLAEENRQLRAALDKIADIATEEEEDPEGDDAYDAEDDLEEDED